MPTYVTKCTFCTDLRDHLVLRNIGAWKPPRCEKCGNTTEKQVTSASFKFAKGGFSASSSEKE